MFLPKTCSKHPNAPTLLGSRLLRMSADILTKASFRCVYCGERCGCGSHHALADADTPPDPEEYLQPDADHYRAIWHAPPRRTAEAILAAAEQGEVMNTYSPFCILPDDEEEVPFFPPRKPANGAASLDVDPEEEDGAPKPFESALPYPMLNQPSISAAVHAPASPFQELWHRGASS